jgi:hypothetical protein
MGWDAGAGQDVGNDAGIEGIPVVNEIARSVETHQRDP